MRKKVSEYCQNCGVYIPKHQMYCDKCGAICMDKLPKNTGLRGVWVQFKRRMVLLWLTIIESFGYKPTFVFDDSEEQTKK